MKILLEDEIQMVAAKSTVALSVTSTKHYYFIRTCKQELAATFGPHRVISNYISS